MDSSNSINIFGFNISAYGLINDVNASFNFIKDNNINRYVVCANPHSLVVTSYDSQFSETLHNADILLPDGAGIVLAARVLNLPIKERVAGTEFFLGLSDRLSSSGGARYFFLGSSEHVLALLRQRLEKEYPNITVCGTYSPPFKSEFSDVYRSTVFRTRFVVNHAASIMASFWMARTAAGVL